MAWQFHLLQELGRAAVLSFMSWTPFLYFFRFLLHYLHPSTLNVHVYRRFMLLWHWLIRDWAVWRTGLQMRSNPFFGNQNCLRQLILQQYCPLLGLGIVLSGTIFRKETARSKSIGTPLICFFTMVPQPFCGCISCIFHYGKRTLQMDIISCKYRASSGRSHQSEACGSGSNFWSTLGNRTSCSARF